MCVPENQGENRLVNIESTECRAGSQVAKVFDLINWETSINFALGATKETFKVTTTATLIRVIQQWFSVIVGTPAK